MDTKNSVSDTQVLSCNHCGQEMQEDQRVCSRCGTLSPFAQKESTAGIQRKFFFFFIFVVIISFILVLWLPPDW